MCVAARWLHQRLGRRGTFLLIIGIGEMGWGAGILFDPPSTLGLSILTDRCPLSTWSWLWIGGGAAALAAAFVKIGRDWAGFLAAFSPPVVWALAYGAAAVSGDYSRGGFVAVWYLTIVGIIMWAATVPEHSVPPPPRRSRKGKAP